MLTLHSKKQSGVFALLQVLSDETHQNNAITTDNLTILQSQLLAVLDGQKKSSDKDKELENISSKCLSLVEEGKNVATAQKILKSLHFKTIKTRQISVKEAHAKTFEWIFKDSKDSLKPRPMLREWMSSQTQNGVYWVS